MDDRPPPDFAVRPIVLLSMAAFASAASLRVADPLLPQIAEEFRTGVADASVIATGFAFAYGLSQLAYGPLGDRLGKFRIVALATLLSALASGAAAFAGSLPVLGALRLLGGTLAGAIIPLSLAHIGDVVPYERRQAVLARFLSGQILGVMAGQAFGGAIGDWLGWRGAFGGLAVLYLLVGALLWSERRAVAHVRPGPAAGFRGLAGSYLRLARSPRVRLLVAVVSAEGALFFGGFTYLGAYLRDSAGLRYGLIGAVLAAFGIGALVYAGAAPRLVARFGQRGLVTLGGAAVAAGLGAVALPLPWWGVPPLVALMGIGFYMLHNTLQTLATQMAPEARGLAVSVFAAGLFLGQAAGVAVGGRIAATAGYGPLFLGCGLGLLALSQLLRRRLDPAGGRADLSAARR